MTSILAVTVIGACWAYSPSKEAPLVRLADLEINSAQLDSYKAALTETIDTSIRVEPGVLTLYAVAEKEHPNRIRILEIYASDAAYKAHLNSKHFQRYKTVTYGMIKSLNLMETDPIVLGSKASR